MIEDPPKKVKICGYPGCKAPLKGAKTCIICKKGASCPRCARCRYCSGDFAKV